MTYFSETLLDAMADALTIDGYLIIDKSMPDALLQNLSDSFQALNQSDFKAAGIGRQSDFQLHESIRSDKIHWITNTTVTTSDFLQWMESLRVGLNRRLFLGLFDYESHFAYYPIGAFYKKHVDAFRDSRKSAKSNRVLSTVLYLNKDWHTSHGGELVVYHENGQQILEKILPEFGRMIIFLSEKFPHEVLAGNRERKSIAGWFRINESQI
jgi:SM-20-related protein